MDGTRGRRERLRAETTAEIKQVALALMAADGPNAITLRAIARAMGMTANAIYGYFATRDDLVTTLINDVHTALADAMESAWSGAPGASGASGASAGPGRSGGRGRAGDAVGPADPGERIRAWANALRGWALANPQGFRLIYGDPVPGYQAPPGGPAPAAAHRLCLGLTAVAAAAWPFAQHLHGGGDLDGDLDGDFDWSDFDPGLLAKIRPAFPELPPAGVALALRIWGHLHGLVTLEIYGHLRGQTISPDKLYRQELTGLLRGLGLASGRGPQATGRIPPPPPQDGSGGPAEAES